MENLLLALWYIGLILFVTIVPMFFYFLPALVAWERGLKNALSITLLNLFLGWTILGWVIAICLASMGTAAKRA